MRRALLLFCLLPGAGFARTDLGVLFVPGAYSSVDPRQRGLSFLEHKAALDAAGIPWREVPIASTRPHWNSVPSLRHALATAPWDYSYIVSLSMGGFVTEAALLGAPELEERLAGWIAYQTPFYGTTRADRATAYFDRFDPFRLRRHFDWTGTSALVAAASREERLPYMRRHHDEFLALALRRPIVCVTSDADELVDARSAVLPGAVEVTVSGARHLDLAVGRQAPAYRDVFRQSLRALGDCVRRLAHEYR